MRLLPLLAVVCVLGAAAAVGLGGPAGAGVAAVAGALVAFVSLVLVRGEEIGTSSRVAARHHAEARFLALLVVAGFLMRAVVAVTLRQMDLNLVLGGDEGTFDGNARVFAAWLDGRLPFAFQARWAGTSQVGYFVIVGTLYHLLGAVQIVPVLLNCLLGALTAVPVHRIAGRIGGRTAARVAAVLVIVFPSLLLWSSLLVRDALAFFLIAWCASLGQDLLRRVRLPPIVLLLCALALLATLRSYMFLLLGGALVTSFLASAMRRPGRALAVALIATLGVLVLVRGAGLGLEFVGEDVLSRIDEQRRLNALAGNTAIEFSGHEVATPLGALTYLPVGLTYFLLAPFPWQMEGRQVLALPDMLLWYACLPAVLLGIVSAYRRRRSATLPPLVAAAAITCLYALVEGNVGIIVRHRAQILVLLVPFAAVHVARVLRVRRRRAREEAERLARLLHVPRRPRGVRAALGPETG